MKWNKFKIKTMTQAEEIVSAMLIELGVEGIEIEDKIPLTQQEKEAMFIDIMPQMPVDDGVAYISFYLEECQENELLLRQVKEELQGLSIQMNTAMHIVEESQTEDLDWVNNWKEYFHQFYIDDILVVPSWEEVEDNNENTIVIRIDPGTAFGTGMHETTQLCVRQIRKYVTKDTSILDIGCGSGILGMLALKFGAKYSVGTDLDPCAIDATAENMQVNNIDQNCYKVMIGNVIDEEQVQKEVGQYSYDIIAANILANVLILLTPVVIAYLKVGGVFITSGILREKETSVASAMKVAGLEIVEVTYQGDWVSITAKKN